jgi:hypothetical protein
VLRAFSHPKTPVPTNQHFTLKKLFVLSSILFAAAPIAAVAAQPVRMPEVTTEASYSGLAEERPVGPTGRPEWTSARRFTTTRVYIQKNPWEVGVEQWWRIRDKRDDTIENLFIEEIEVGLPFRMQLDLYENWTVDDERKARHDNFAVELRWALADWGVIPMNPTLYAEYKWVDKGSDVVEFKLLLGDQILPRLHYGINFVYEKEFSNADRVAEFQIAGGLSYTVLDEKIGLGVEAKYVQESTHFYRSEPEQKFLVGPSVQFRLTPRLHLDLVCLFGTNRDAQRHEGWMVLGYDFGPQDEHGYKPTSGMRN